MKLNFFLTEKYDGDANVSPEDLLITESYETDRNIDSSPIESLVMEKEDLFEDGGSITVLDEEIGKGMNHLYKDQGFKFSLGWQMSSFFMKI